MAKQLWKPGNMLYPLPAVMVTVSDRQGNSNIITVAWTGTVCTNPAMTYISVRPERYSYDMLKETGEFVINLTTKKLAYAVDYCGVKSGRDVDKFAQCGLTRGKPSVVHVPLIQESPVNMECRVTEVKELGSHHMFLAEVVAVHADEAYMNEKGSFDLSKAEPLVYSHGGYYALGEKLGTFGYSVRKKAVTKAKGKPEKAESQRVVFEKESREKTKRDGNGNRSQAAHKENGRGSVPKVAEKKAKRPNASEVRKSRRNKQG